MLGPGVQQASSCYDVFLSFRGKDTRKNFADHLYTALLRNGIRTVRDKEDVERGKGVRLEIENAVRRSTISIVILSKDYASSRWCLTELALIMERRRTEGHHVLPIFYDVEPSDVRYQTGEYGKAFVVHEKRLGGDSQAGLWRKVLQEIAELSGMTLDNGYEAIFVEDIVNEVRNRLDKQLVTVFPKPVGREDFLNQMSCGIPTIFEAGKLGKLRTWKTALNTLTYDFQGCSPIDRVREDSENDIIPLHMGSPSDSVERKDMAVCRHDAGTSGAHIVRTESNLIEEAVEVIKKMLHKPKLQMPQGVHGREDLISEINHWVHSQKNDIDIAIIFGIKGVGKTTIAKIIYDLNHARFDGSSFIGNTIGYCQEVYSIINLQRKLLSDLSKRKDISISNLEEGIMKIKAATYCKKVLIVCDNVFTSAYFDVVAMMQQWLFPGSKIIILVRSENLVRGLVKFKKFEVPRLNFHDSLHLLAWNAFGYHPIMDYVQCLEGVVRRCGGLPIALKVIGCSLKGKDRAEWESVLKELVVDSNIGNILTIGYNRLPDDDKPLFLDIAYLFVGKDKDEVIAILEDCGYNANIGIQSLIDRCFLFIDKDNKIGMDEFLVNMGRAIVHQELLDAPGQRSELLHDAYYVLTRNTGKEAVEVICFGLEYPSRFGLRKRRDVNRSKQEKTEGFLGSIIHHFPFTFRNLFKTHKTPVFQESIMFDTDAFRDVLSLRLFQFEYYELLGSYEEFPEKLLWLSCHGYPLESIPKEFHLMNIVALEMCNSQLKHNWKNGQVLFLLKSLNLSACQSLVRTPDLEGLPNLERLILKYCTNLVEVDNSIGNLKKLIFLNLHGCINLRKLSRVIVKLKSLKELDVSACPKLEKLPTNLSKYHSLKIYSSFKLSTNQSEYATEEVLKKFSPSWPRTQKAPEDVNYLKNLQILQPNHALQGTPIRTCTKVHMEGAEVGRAVDLSQFNSYDDLFKGLEKLFGMDSCELLTKKLMTVYIDYEGDTMMVGDDPWHEFQNMVRKIIIHPQQQVKNPKTCLMSTLYISWSDGKCSCMSLQSIGLQEDLSLAYNSCSYDVFLSFKSDDTCGHFVNHLCSALNGAGIQTSRGQKMAIQESRMFIIVFSDGYASSTSCLDELQQIMACQRTFGRLVLPVYYNCDPASIRKQATGFVDAFRRHKTLLKKDMERTQGWTKAIAEVMSWHGPILRKGMAS